MSEQKIAVIGCGVWGRNIVRNFYNLNVLDTGYLLKNSGDIVINLFKND